MSQKIKVLIVGCGNMGASHAKAYENHKGFEICGLVSRGESKTVLNAALKENYPLFSDIDTALLQTKPDTVCISTYPETHEPYAVKALQMGCHVFLEKPLATTVKGAQKVIDAAVKNNRKVVVGYILRHHPTWVQFIEEAQKLGKPLVMRMNLNQQSQGYMWGVHRNLMQSLSPIVDCGVHYLDVMCQMTRSKPVSVTAIGARLTDDIPDSNYNYGQLQIRFEDASVGWYEAGWGPMMSETAFFIKDVVGPKGAVSIVSEEGLYKDGSDDVEHHTKSDTLKIHSAALKSDHTFVEKDQFIRFENDPSHQDLCDYEQAFFYKAITESLDLTDHLEDALQSLKIALACDEAVKTQQTISLKED